VREHGGDIALSNIARGGLRARVELHAMKRAVDDAWRRNSAAGR